MNLLCVNLPQLNYCCTETKETFPVRITRNCFILNTFNCKERFHFLNKATRDDMDDNYGNVRLSCLYKLEENSKYCNQLIQIVLMKPTV